MLLNTAFSVTLLELLQAIFTQVAIPAEQLLVSSDQV